LAQVAEHFLNKLEGPEVKLHYPKKEKILIKELIND
jgi:hypothetical protein